MPQTSIVMTAYNRANLLAITLDTIRQQEFKDYEIIVVQDDDGNEKLSIGREAPNATEEVCKHFNVDKFIRRVRPAKATFSNPAIPNNIGLKAAEGEVVILQNAECRHMPVSVIENLTTHVLDTQGVVFAAVRSLDMGGLPSMWYSHPTERPKPYFFCGAMLNSDIQRLRGFDEDYTEVGYDDDDFGVRIEYMGIPIKFLEKKQAYVEHLWHPSSYTNMPTNEEMFKQKTAAMQRGELSPSRNLGRDWGVSADTRISVR